MPKYVPTVYCKLHIYDYEYVKCYEKGDIADDVPFGKCLSA